MSTIPITSEYNSIQYTIVGDSAYDPGSGESPRLTILLLNRGGKFHREDLIAGLRSVPFTEVLFFEGPELTYDIEPLSKKYPEVRFLLLREKISAGEKINLGISESRSNLVYVLWSNMAINRASLSDECIKRMNEKSVLCSVPILKNVKHEIIPSIQVPGISKKDIKVVPWVPSTKKIRSIFPFDFCGIYDKKKFKAIGGYDSRIESPYWQKMDFGFRAFLWGETIRLNPDLTLSYTHDISADDTTPKNGYTLFYLKNIFITCKKGSGVLPVRKLLSYILHSDTGPFDSFREFQTIRRWVKKNRERFRLDAFTLLKTWEVPE
ncbi:MAG: hypothetical protein JW881_00830 [Spirochaetales bacterium]|nr:hypothetical protein [Spirochaetales bacterium]